MEKLTNNKNWNVYSELCGMTSTRFIVMNDDMDEHEMCFVNDSTRAFAVCDALNKCNVN